MLNWSKLFYILHLFCDIRLISTNNQPWEQNVTLTFKVKDPGHIANAFESLHLTIQLTVWSQTEVQGTEQMQVKHAIEPRIHRNKLTLT